MQFESNNLYHIYNQGNNKQQIFFSDANYLHFLRNYRKFVSPFAETFAYCLMPNHFHFLIHTNENSIHKNKIGSLYLTQLSNGIRQCLSSYAAAINTQQRSSGSLFRQKTKADLIDNSSVDYSRIAFHYIHLNPLQAKLVSNLKQWKYSSYLDYADLRNGNLCNKKLAKQNIDIDWMRFEKETMDAFGNRKNSC